ncbi:LOW QUALITY PROTEIN: hypothetical protein BC937DRAFT_87758 [Endogone sp. FLAS-F59071]|nr:LOW QUALITY PROTEIN: hypothetical protein BC937DRAFT_87758 [Endogone sp. FLAS-F59071]|eukprot:RUS12486.1 LOW QUALITY PROTEIN: hypothetical protein BC937DRAFT_87758 [Endogone sp. FLAS-F59071]
MHGFFVDLRLYEKVSTGLIKKKEEYWVPQVADRHHLYCCDYCYYFLLSHLTNYLAKLIANPFAYDEYRENVIREKLEKERGSRIRATTKLPKVNKILAKQLLEEEVSEELTLEIISWMMRKVGATNPLNDPRFAGMFTDKEFEVDEEAQEYKLLHPTAVSSHNLRSLSPPYPLLPFLQSLGFLQSFQRKKHVVTSDNEDDDEEDEEDEQISPSNSLAKIRKSRGDKGKKKEKAPRGIRSAPDERWRMKEKTKGFKKDQDKGGNKGPRVVEMKVR